MVPARTGRRRRLQPVPTKRPIILYSLLAVLFAVTLLYQVFYLPGFIHL